MAETSDVIVSPHPNHCEGITPTGAHLESRGGHLLWEGRRPMAKRRFTQREWQAIGEALGFRLADVIEDADPPVEVYESAWDKVQERLR